MRVKLLSTGISVSLMNVFLPLKLAKLCLQLNSYILTVDQHVTYLHTTSKATYRVGHRGSTFCLRMNCPVEVGYTWRRRTLYHAHYTDDIPLPENEIAIFT